MTYPPLRQKRISGSVFYPHEISNDVTIWCETLPTTSREKRFHRMECIYIKR